MLVGRAENFFAGRPDLADAISRLTAYSAAGAECLYAPGISTPQQIKAVVAAVSPKPVNLLVGSATPLDVGSIAALGVRRISVGGALARTAWQPVIDAARLIAEQGRFDGFSGAAQGDVLNALFARTNHSAR